MSKFIKKWMRPLVAITFTCTTSLSPAWSQSPLDQPSEAIANKEALRAFETAQAFDRLCEARQLRSRLIEISAIGLIGVTLYSSIGYAWNTGLVTMIQNMRDYLAKNAAYGAPEESLEFKMIMYADEFLETRGDPSRALRRGGIAAVILTTLLVGAIFIGDQNVVTVGNELGKMKGQFFNSMANRPNRKNPSLAACYAENTQAFVDDFLKLKPEQAVEIMDSSSQLKQLVVAFAEFVDTISNEQLSQAQTPFCDSHERRTAVNGLKTVQSRVRTQISDN